MNLPGLLILILTVVMCLVVANLIGADAVTDYYNQIVSNLCAKRL
jgi:hypothetical protein